MEVLPSHHLFCDCLYVIFMDKSHEHSQKYLSYILQPPRRQFFKYLISGEFEVSVVLNALL